MLRDSVAVVVVVVVRACVTQKSDRTSSVAKDCFLSYWVNFFRYFPIARFHVHYSHDYSSKVSNFMLLVVDIVSNYWMINFFYEADPQFFNSTGTHRGQHSSIRHSLIRTGLDRLYKWDEIGICSLKKENKKLLLSSLKRNWITGSKTKAFPLINTCQGSVLKVSQSD